MTLEELLKRTSETAYAEPETPLHNQLIEQLLPEFETTLPRASNVLDVGCGACYAAKKFRDAGHTVLAASILPAEVEAAKAMGFEAAQMDMHNIYFDGRFDCVWMRHVIEHSPVPLLVLVKAWRALKPGGVLYLEVPAPDTACHHERNGNHWSVLPMSVWAELLTRSGFVETKARTISFKVLPGDDTYFQFVAKRPA